MFVYPTSTIVFLQDVPLDNSYEHTIYFSTQSDQENYFLGKYKHSITKPSGKVVSFYLTGQTYTRVGDDIRVGICADDLYDCNYIMFQNTNFGTKWFYAFLKSVKYVNNEVSIVQYEIDPMQTWFFDYELGMTFVEREHSASDNAFENLVEENLDVGSEIVCKRKYDTLLYDKTLLSIVVMYAGLDTTALEQQPNLLPSGYFMPCYYFFVRSNAAGAQIATQVLTNGNQIQDPNDVIACYQAPGTVVGGSGEEATLVDRPLELSIPIDTDNPIFANRSDLDGYVPKNKKLYNSPYNQIIVTNNVGGSAVYKFENSGENAHTILLKRISNSIPTPVALVYPRNYRKIPEDYDSGLAFYDFPVCGWVTDTYKAWWAQNGNRVKAERAAILTSGAAHAINGIIRESSSGRLRGNNQRMIGSTIENLIDSGNQVNMSLAKEKDIEALPNAAGGQFKCDVLNMATDRIGFTVYWMTIKQEYAIIIDNYFTKYGYACKKLKYPNRKARRYWTYVKTVGCVISPLANKGLPCDDEGKICSIYDNGITFWKYTRGETLAVGNYNQDNAPTGQEGG